MTVQERYIMAELPEREAMEFDVVIVGAGPAGLAAAIRLKQVNADINVVVVEKGSEVGAHILSGAVVDPAGLDRLLPDWRNEDSPLRTAVSDDRIYYLGETGSVRLPRVKYTLFAEGARGNLGKQLIAKFGLGDGREPQKFGIGLKELWQVAPEKHR